MFANRLNGKTLVLFDVDGTLTPARQGVSEDMLRLLAALRQKVVIGFVGGSDLAKQKEQLGENCLELFDYCFSENGLTAYCMGEPLPSQSFINWLGEEKYRKLVDFILSYIANLDLPKKRNGMINVSPIGRNCSIPERSEFEAYDKKHQIRSKMVQVLREKFKDYDLTYSIGGQISFDVFPTGWDKTYCLRHVEKQGFEKIHFFGDKTFPGGNDHEIYTHPWVTGHSVKNPSDTAKILTDLYGL